MSYQQLAGEGPPRLPPDYNDIERFNIEEPESEQERRSLREVTRDMADQLNSKLVIPITRVLDPVYEYYSIASMKFDSYLAKVGNPLIVKRLFFVFLVALLMYVITITGLYDNAYGSYTGEFRSNDALFAFLDEQVSGAQLEEQLEYISSMPHAAGTAGGLSLARYVDKFIAGSGLDLRDFFEVRPFINYPNEVSLKLYNEKEEEKFTAKLKERGIKEEGGDDMQLISFNYNSMYGEHRGNLVYANYGLSRDFNYLKDKNIELKDSVLLMRNGFVPAFQKVQYAEVFGCKGVIFISDPDSSSGYDMFSIEREDVGVSNFAPGDILSPGFSTAKSDHQYHWDDSPGTSRIVTIPISWADAIPLLKSLNNVGEKVPESWNLNIKGEKIATFTGGSTKSQVHIVNHPIMKEQKSIWNVLGKIQGREQDEEAIVIGAQRDSSCFGACESGTSTSILLSLIRIFGEMSRRLNWKPLRSIYFASFDGTNFNMAGSTEWVEARSRELRRQAYCYIDLSDAITGNQLDIKSHPLLKTVIESALFQVTDPISNETFSQLKTKISPLDGLKRNYIPFTSYEAIPSLDIGFRSPEGYPKGSCLDSFERFKEKQVDPDMQYHETLVKIIGRIMIHLTNEPSIPFDFGAYANELAGIKEDVNRYYKDVLGDANTLNFQSLDSSLGQLRHVSDQLSEWITGWSNDVGLSGGLESTLLAINRWTWNNRQSLFEKKLRSNYGIPRRPWFKNLIYGQQYIIPDHPENYLYSTFPGVRDAIYNKDAESAQQQLEDIAKSLSHVCEDFLSR
ncbi:hypothetical protein LJB42_003617 [Komagataella kurtzmanii]|nr:hypothetical protein LJB42_003617 [Komagataella kurtzmanii]